MNTLKEKVGPIPLWGWLLGLSALALVYWWWSNRNSASSASTTSTSSTTAEGQVPEFVIQNQEPTVAGPPGPAGAPGKPGPQGPPGKTCNPNVTQGYTLVTVAEANADRKAGATVMWLESPTCPNFVQWSGQPSGAGTKLYISNAWLSQHGRKPQSNTHTASSAAPAGKAPARPAAAAAVRPADSKPAPPPPSKAPRRTPVKAKS